ncbi:hypothetical protein [Winogradskyella sp. A2]|uniref:hypothetical protein n=1 Tax=Winogradskyella sp. A2 TaxID=3366944 RepID=UPI00398C65D1
MKKGLLCISILCSTLVFSQEQFAITEEGLTPKTITVQFEKTDLYTKALQWITDHTKTYNLEVLETVENESIQFTSTKGNAVSLDKQYYNIRYTISLSFTDNQYSFETKTIDLKLNSKYDMGWKPFDQNNTAQYFKKGKPIKKYRAYLSSITATLNALHLKLANYLKNN